jgi:hypothetical protein
MTVNPNQTQTPRGVKTPTASKTDPEKAAIMSASGTIKTTSKMVPSTLVRRPVVVSNVGFFIDQSNASRGRRLWGQSRFFL